MNAIAMQAAALWTGHREEDRRFRRILLWTLLPGLVLGIIAPYVPLPMSVFETSEPLPPRRVQLIRDPIALPPAPAPAQPATAPAQPAPATKAPAPQPRPEEPPALSPREKAAQSGVLAMRNLLEELQETRPRIEAAPRRDSGATPAQISRPGPAHLTANVTRIGNAGEIGVSHREVLGDDGLPERVPGTYPDAETGQSSGPFRSVEEIQEILDRNKGAMHTLYNRALHTNAGLHGTLVMSITIEPAGRVSHCAIVSSTVDSVSLERQMVSLVMGIDFGDKPGTAVVTTRVPIEFFPI
jgi:outer membrane biosynthesis protein TonB